MDAAAAHGDRVFIIDATTGESITYAQFHQRASAFAAALAHCGVVRGDRVAVMGPNCAELAAVYFGCMYLGATIIPLNPNLSRPEIGFILSNSKPLLAAASSSCQSKLEGQNTPLVVFTPAAEQAPEGDTNLLIGRDGPTDFPRARASENDLISIMYTSGTTSQPKGLAHRVSSMVENSLAFAGMQGLDESTRFYSTLSLTYMGGFYNLLMLPFLLGASVVIDRVFEARTALTYWDIASRYQANTLWLVPTAMSVIMKMDRGGYGAEYCAAQVRRAFVGFGPLPLKLKQEFESRYKVPLIENYGLSETLFVSARTGDRSLGSGYVGEPVPGCRVRIVDDRGAELSPAREGEIEVLTAALMEGYLDNAGEIIPSDAATWFPTGDYGYLSIDGSLVVTGRKKDVIIRGGINVSPAAIEEVLRHYSGVIDAAVVSIPHELYGEDIVAVLRLEPKLELDEIRQSIAAHAQAYLASHQQPACYVSIDDFPRTSNGKIQKAHLRELVMTKFQLRVGAGAQAMGLNWR
jgi:long-chain acyl-CoA synthetase